MFKRTDKSNTNNILLLDEHLFFIKCEHKLQASKKKKGKVKNRSIVIGSNSSLHTYANTLTSKIEVAVKTNHCHWV